MGVIRKQSIYSGIYTYIGFAIGAVNLLVLLTPKFGFFELDESGLTRLLLEFAVLFSVIGAMGSLTTFIKFYPFHHLYLKKEENDLPFLTMLVCALGACILIVCFLVFEDFFARKFGKNSALFIEHFKLVIPLTVSVIIFNLFEAYAWMIQRTIQSNFAKEVIVRVGTLCILLSYYLGWISLETFFVLYSLIYVPAFLYVGYIVFKDGEIKLIVRISRVTKRLQSKIFTFGFYHFTSGVFHIVPKTIDVIMIASVVEGGLGKALIYSIPIYLVTVMEVPQRSMLGIGSSIISEAWKRNDIWKINNIYKKSSINLLVAGLFIFGIILLNIDNLIIFMGDEFLPIKQIFLILGIAKLIDLSTGLNNLILGFSKYWKTDFYTNIIFIFISVFITYTLTKRWGMTGTAFGGAITMIGYNALRLFFIYRLINLQPFSKKTFIALILGIVSLGVVSLIPFIWNIYFDSIVRTLIFLFLLAPGLLHFNISTDVKELYKMAKSKLFKNN